MGFQNAVQAKVENSNFIADVAFAHGMSMREIERSVILETLKWQSFNRTRTARVLGIGIRTLQRKLKQYRDDDYNVVIDFPRY
ncbi:MAG: helix-turn-helix domain-containing protein [Deltaproteobacteria bacterium]|nr:helix-turn-helix domain-containing protein [Deltaproteobacteria bacterium]